MMYPAIHPPTVTMPLEHGAAPITKALNWLFDEPAVEAAERPIEATLHPEGFRDVVLVLDASGSMQTSDWPPSRLEAAKAAALSFCARLARDEPRTGVGVVGYGSVAKTMCGLTRAGETETLHRAIERLSNLGSTNIRAGLKRAAELLKGSGSDSQVVLLSDGRNTARSPLAVAERLRARATIDCVGIGGHPSDVDEALLKQIASENPDGSKRYRWIGERERLVKHFNEIAGRISRT